MSKNLFILLLTGFLMTFVGCAREKGMDAYPEFTDLFPTEMARFPPVILVGRILSGEMVGSPQPSIWGPSNLYQKCRTTVAVENVLNGGQQSGTVDIYFLKDVRASGPPRLGTVRQGGHWQIGDREMFFLQRDSGRLRTVCDTFVHCVVPVLSGRHDSFQPSQNIGESIAEILFTRGKSTTDDQMIRGLDNASFLGSHFAPLFSIHKLEQLVKTETPAVRQAACKTLRQSNRSAPFDNPSYAQLLARDPEFLRAIAVCPSE